MTSIDRQSAAPPPSSRFQFSLRTLLLLFVVLGSSLAVFGVWGVGVFVLVVGLACCAHYVESMWPLFYFPSVALCLTCLAWLLLPTVASIREVSPRVDCAFNLQQTASALRRYHEANSCFPPAFVVDGTGKPTLSWRVLILPDLEMDVLKRFFDLSEPWNGPNNKRYSDTGLIEFTCPSDPNAHVLRPTVNYVAVVGPNAVWAGAKSRKLADFGEDASSTIMLIEVSNSGIAWSEPRDLSLDTLGTDDAKSPTLTVASHHLRRKEFFFVSDDDSCVNVAMADGSVRLLDTAGLSTADLRKILQIGGCKEEQNRLHDPFSARRRPNWPNIAALAVWLLSVGTLLTHAVRSRKRSSVPPPLAAC